MPKLISRIYSFYRDGFAGMTVGRSLWVLILIKAVIFFLILKLFFFPDVVSDRTEQTGESSGEVVRSSMLGRTTMPK